MKPLYKTSTSTGYLAQPSTHLFDRESGTFTTRDQVMSWTGKYPTCGPGSRAVNGAEGVTKRGGEIADTVVGAHEGSEV